MSASVATVRAARVRARADLQVAALGAVREVGAGAKDVAIAAIQNPIMSMVAAVVAIEALQNVRIKDWANRVPVYRGPGGTFSGFEPGEKPLLSQALATTLQTTIITSKTIESLGGLASLIGGIKGLSGAVGGLLK